MKVSVKNTITFVSLKKVVAFLTTKKVFSQCQQFIKFLLLSCLTAATLFLNLSGSLTGSIKYK